jgi:hypothetical protein
MNKIKSFLFFATGGSIFHGAVPPNRLIRPTNRFIYCRRHIRGESMAVCLFTRGADKSFSPTRKETSYSDRRFWCSYILFIIIIVGILVLFMYITRLASNEISSPSKKYIGKKVRLRTCQHPGKYKGSSVSHCRTWCLIYWRSTDVRGNNKTVRISRVIFFPTSGFFP